ncbi:hypothetical protein PLESTF_000791500 [Pleodorina starrii]|nr:hypothetical protein PLESTM_001174000 [Pleodorina starrii]GLC69115.1 hypothetical protein PLESTF_000791500 [Pleodorina starrii]
MEGDSGSGPSFDDIGRARRSLQEAEAIARKAKVLPGDPARSDVDRLESDQQQQVDAALQHAQGVGRELRTKAMLRDPRVGDDDDAGADQGGHERAGGGQGLLSTAAHVVSAVVGNFSESLKTGVDSAVSSVRAPPAEEHHQAGGEAEGEMIGGGGGGGGERGGGGDDGGGGGGGAVRVRDMLGGSDADTPYPGDMVDEPVQLEGGDTDKTGDRVATDASAAADADADSGGLQFGGRVVGGLTPHVEVSEQRRRDPDIVTPREGGPATTIRDSGVMVNTGPTEGGGARAQGFGFGGGDPAAGGGTLGLLGLVKEAIATATGAHTVDGSLGGFNRGATAAPQPDEAAQLEQLRERMEGMPGNMPIDREIREQRAAQAEERMAALAAQREAVSSAAREAISQRHPDTAERMGLGLHQHAIHDGKGAQEQAAEREGHAAAAGGGGGGGGGLLASLAHTLGDVLGLGGGGGGGRGSEHREDEERAPPPASVEEAAAALPRKPVPVGTSPLEAKPVDKTAIGVPAAAEADAERGSSSINTKESGRQVPAGALGSSVTDPAQHNPSFAPDFNKPNFFAEVEKRGLGDVLQAGAASLRGSAEQAVEEIRHGGAPAPGSTTMGAVADTKDIARNVERADHLDDPVQRRIYDAEVIRVTPGKEAAADRHSEAEAVKEATSAMVLGKDRQVSGAEPHGIPPGAHPAPPIKQQAGGQSVFGSFGTGSAGPRRSREVKDAFEAFTAATGNIDEATVGGQWMAARASPSRRRASSGQENEYSLSSWAARVGAAFTARAGGGEEEAEEGEQEEQEGQPPRARQPYNPDDPADYAESKIHSGVPGVSSGSRPKEPSGKEIKDAQYLKVYEEPHSKIMHIQGANFNWDRNKDREAGQTTTATDNPTLFDTAGRAIHKAVTGEHYEGVPPMGYDTPGGREAAFQVAKDVWTERVHKAPEIGADVAARTEESVVGVLEHISQAAGQAASGVAQLVRSGLADPVPMDQRLAEAAARQEEREVVYEQDFAPASPAGAVHQRRLDQMTAAGDPALKRDTLVDKLLYPWTKDAPTDDSTARETAKSYKQYIREKEEKGEPYDPLGAMAHDREYDTAKLPATVQQVERSRVDSSQGERHGNNQEFLTQRAPYAGQAPLPEGAKAAIRSLADDSEAHGRPTPRGLQELQERVAEEEERGGARGALTSRGPPAEDRAAYRDPQSAQAWHAAEVLQSNIDRTVPAATGQQQQQQQQQGGGVTQAAEGAARGTAEAAGSVAGAVRGATERAGEEIRGAADTAVGSIRGAAEVAGGEVNRAVGAAGGAAQVAGEEASRAAGGLLGSLQRGLRSLVGAGGGQEHDAAREQQQQQREEHEQREQAHHTTTYSDAPRAIADIYTEQEQQQQQQRQGGEGGGQFVAERVGESAATVREDVSRRAEGAARVVGDTARQTAEGVGQAAERGGEAAAQGAGGLLGALRGLFIGGDDSRDQQIVEERRQREEAAEEREAERRRREGSGASDVGPGVDAGDVSEGLGRVAGGIAGVVDKVLGGDGGGKEGERGEVAAPAGPDVPVVPYTSTAEILAARHQEQEQY